MEDQCTHLTSAVYDLKFHSIPKNTKHQSFLTVNFLLQKACENNISKSQ